MARTIKTATKVATTAAKDTRKQVSLTGKVTAVKGRGKKAVKDVYIRNTPPPLALKDDPIQYSDETPNTRKGDSQTEYRFTLHPIKKIVSYSQYRKTALNGRRTALFLAAVSDSIIRRIRFSSVEAYNDFRAVKNTKHSKDPEKHKAEDKISVNDIGAAVRNHGRIVDLKSGRTFEGIPSISAAFGIFPRRSETSIAAGNDYCIRKEELREVRRIAKESLAKRKEEREEQKEKKKEKKSSQKAKKEQESKNKKQTKKKVVESESDSGSDSDSDISDSESVQSN